MEKKGGIYEKDVRERDCKRHCNWFGRLSDIDGKSYQSLYSLQYFSLASSGSFPPFFLIASIIYGVFCITAGVLGLRLKPVAPSLMLSVGHLLFILVLGIFVCFGFLANPIQLLVLAGLAAVIMAAYSRKTMLELDGFKERHRKTIRLIHISAVVLSILIILGYGYFQFVYFSRNNYQVTFSKVKWAVHPAASAEIYAKYKIWGLNVMVPEGMSLRRPIHNQNAVFIDKNKTTAIFVSRENLFESLAPIGRLLGEKDSCIFGEKVLNEKIGAVFLILKSLMGPGDFYPIDSPKWKGYIEVRQGTMSLSFGVKIRSSPLR